ncbi:putative ribonuclease H-like domain-containing protein [Tanacetum coccineum]
MTAQSTNSTNNVNIANPDVSTVTTNVNTASPKDDTATLSDATIYAFLSNQPKGSQLVHEDLEQIHDDDLEEMDLKWQLALLSMRARKFYQRTGRKITINGSDTAGFDKSKVECFNCHKMGHFAREYTSSKAMLDIDGIGFDWSDIEEEQVQTNMALMAFSDSEVYNDKSCSKTYLKNYETLKKQCDVLIVKLNDTEFKADTYKRGLATIEDQLVIYKKNEVLFSEEITVLKRVVGCKEYELGVLRTELEKVKQEKKGIDFKITKFDNASKDLDKLLESQRSDKNKQGLGYHVVAPPHPLIYNIPTKLDFSYSGLDEFKEPDFNRYGLRDTILESTKDCSKESDNSKENTDDSVETEQVSEDTNSSSDDTCSLVESLLKVNRETVIDWHNTGAHSDKKEEFVKPKNNEKLVKKTVSPQHVGFGDLPDLMVHHLFSKDITTLMHEADPSNPQMYDKGFVDSGCSRHMTGNIAYLSYFKEFDGGHVTFGGGAYGGRISSKGTLKTDSLDFDDVYFVKELNFNLFSVSQMCDKRNYVLFTDTECLVLSPNFKLPDENQILLRIPREDNMYSFDMKNIVPKNSLTCLAAKATLDESMLWHRRLGHINFKNINKLVKENLVRGLPLKRFENDQTCVACLKGKQHKASYKSKVMNFITKPLFRLRMDLFGPTFVSSLMHKRYCLVITDDYSRFTWVFFLATKDETSEILKNFIIQIENLVDQKVKIIRYDNGTEFKNKVMDDFCKEKGIRREFSIARTPQQNRVAERRNKTLIEAARTMLADSKLPTTFWAEAVSTACYV